VESYPAEEAILYFTSHPPKEKKRKHANTEKEASLLEPVELGATTIEADSPLKQKRGRKKKIEQPVPLPAIPEGEHILPGINKVFGTLSLISEVQG
jgi:hypothetical protein